MTARRLKKKSAITFEFLRHFTFHEIQQATNDFDPNLLIGEGGFGKSHVTTNVKGSFGYVDPEYFRTKYLTKKSDVYSFGVVLIEVICGKPALDDARPTQQMNLALWALSCHGKGTFYEMMDPYLSGKVNMDSLKKVSELAWKCLEERRVNRPPMGVDSNYLLDASEDASFRLGWKPAIRNDTDLYRKSQSIIYLDLSQNMLEGNIPPNIGNCHKLQYLCLSQNRLKGTIPFEVFSLFSLTNLLDLSQNSLSGSIPKELGMLKNIDELDVSENHLSGDIPRTIGECISLEYLHLQGNSFHGIIPSSLASLKGLQYLDLSRNLLSGPIPDVLQNISTLKHLTVSFNMLDGEVPTKGVFGNASELAVTGNNKLCGDYKGQEFKALVFDYMKNGSLEQWLHPGKVDFEHPRTLDLYQRLNIINDVASALHYLHHECEQPILHCDLKPSNVLLDDDMVAHVSDFGIARLVSTIDGTFHKQTSTIGIKGTVGYTPPEYGAGSEVSAYGDMYSFGILMLEMLTGRRPTDKMFEDDQNLHNFVEISLPDNLLQILDPQLVPRDEEDELEEENNGNFSPNVEKCLVSLFRIGLACSMESPKERMSVADVTRELNLVRKAFLGGVDTREEIKGKSNDMVILETDVYAV
ncbi:Serine/threonine-protein kinase, active site [Sesbania bispinosa]|nr:Serine/threonine-protein kinase, active site [Sesbania bispinosa]